MWSPRVVTGWVGDLGCPWASGKGVGGDSRRRRVGPEGEEEGPRGRGRGRRGAGAGGLPRESHSAAAGAGSGDGPRPRRPDLDKRRAWGPRLGAGGSAGQRRPPGPRRSGAERSWDTGGAAAAPDGTSALGPLVQAGASGEAFTGRFTPAFPSPPAQALLRSLPAHGLSPSAAQAPSHLTPLVLLFAALSPPSPFSGEVPQGLFFVPASPPPPPHPSL